MQQHNFNPAPIAGAVNQALNSVKDIDSSPPTGSTPKPTNLEYALHYASLEIPVFPVHNITATGQCSCGKPECKDAGKHPRTKHGVNDATTDPEQIKEWWRKWPNSNIGAACGVKFDVLDVDPRNGGDKTVAHLMPELLQTLYQTTGGGGWHFFYPPNSNLKSMQGVDVKSKGGYVLLEPSNHKSGGFYEFH